MMDVVVLAGGKCPSDLAEASGAEFRATLPFKGRPMVAWVLDAVRHLGEPVVVGGPEGLSTRQVEAGQSFIESLKNGLDAVKTEHFLLVTADIPFLTPAAVDDFIAQCDTNAMLNYPIINIRDAERAYPGVKRTAIKVREGRFTGGNIAYIRTEAMRRALPIMHRGYGARKKPLKLAAIIGFGTLFRVAGGQVAPAILRIAYLERAIGKFLGDKVHAVISSFPEIGADIDNLEQWRASQS